MLLFRWNLHSRSELIKRPGDRNCDEAINRSRGAPMDAGDLPGTPISGDSATENERARPRVRIIREARVITIAKGTPPLSNIGAACRRNWLSQRSHYRALRNINGTLLWQHQLASSTYVSSPIRARVCVCVWPMTEKERAGKHCRSRSSWIMQPYLYLVSDCDFWEISSLHAQTWTPTRPHVTETHTRGARFSIPSLMSFLSLSFSQCPTTSR